MPLPARLLLATIAAFALMPPARAADPQPYVVTIAPTGQAALDAALSGSSQLLSLRESAPAGPFALVTRARSDVDRLRTALQSYGYYDGQVGITIDGQPIDDASLPDRIAAMSAATPARIEVKPVLGRQFTLGHVAVEGDATQEARAALKLAPGQPAHADDVLAGGVRLLTALQDEGHALAKVAPPVATLNEAAGTLDVTYKVSAGPRVDIGPIKLAGLKDVDADFVRRRLLLHQGELYDPAKIEAARQDLASIGVFSGVTVRAAPALDAEGELPITFDMQERPRHAVSFTAAYSTDLGGSVGVTWSHRNLFGEAEQLNLGAAITGLGGSATTGVGYNVTAALIKPDFLARDQSIEFDLAAIKQYLQAYDQTAETAGVTLSRKLSQEWRVHVGLSLEQETILQESVSRDYSLVSLPLGANYDSTGQSNPLEDPLHGVRAAAIVTPTESIGHGSASFVIMQASASTYVDLADLGLTRPGRSVIALRGLVGSAQGASTFELPPDQRFYGGGSATVRGYKYQSVGPQFPDGNPIGGTAIDAATIEFRQRVWGDIGAAVFADAGQVSPSSAPFEGTLRVGAGVGARYYTPIGPVRVDIAVPLNKPPGGDSFELYIGLGQAF